jgi:hypothetical protein
MAVYDGFFDAALDPETGRFDREYNSEDFTGYFASFLGDGVCLWNNPDSLRVSPKDGGVEVAPGYLFLQGYWLKNDSPYPLAGLSGGYVAAARLNTGLRFLELTALPMAEAYPDCLVLAQVDAAGNVTDTRRDPELCGVVNAAGELSAMAEYAIDYIDHQLEDRLKEAEARLAAQSAELDEKIAQVEGEAAKLAPPPIGTVKFSASQTIEPGWLRCDGSFVSQDDYPELVQALGKVTPGVEEFRELLEADGAELVSNVCLYEGKAWIYLVKSKKLVGLTENGRKEISVAGADRLVELSAVPTVLSVCGGAVYLAQNSQTASTFVLLEYTGFTGSEESISLIELDISQHAADLDTRYCVPYVTDVAGKKYMALGTLDEGRSQETSFSTIRLLKYLKWTAGSFPDTEVEQVDLALVKVPQSTNSIYDYGNAGAALFAFQQKNGGDLLWMQDYTWSSTTMYDYSVVFKVGICSQMQQLYGTPITLGPSSDLPYRSMKLTKEEALKDPFFLEIFATNSPEPARNVLPAAGGSQYIYRAKIEDRRLQYIAGRYEPRTVYDYYTSHVLLPSRARLFQNSICYASAQGIWFVFVGTGLLFTQDLLSGGWGYLDTSETVGTLILFGSLEYSLTENALYLSGVASDGVPKLGVLKLPALYNYANDGAWLPNMASDGVPAYIKAEEQEAAS